MDGVVNGINWIYTLVYIDDIIIFLRSFEEHLVHLQEVFNRLKQANLKLKPSKCFFCRKETIYLGHVLTSDGKVKMDPKKIANVAEFMMPASKEMLQSWLGLMSYYRHFIRNYAQRASPLTQIASPSARFIWHDDAQRAMNDLRRAIVSNPVLRRVNYEKPFLLQTDASAIGVGAVLSQSDDAGKDYAVAYASKKLNPVQQRWDTMTREAYAVLWACELFCHHLIGNKFTLWTDHDALQLLKPPKANQKILRWATQLAERSLM